MEKKLNTGRQLELDLAKALIIVNLATIHTVIECSTDQVLAHGFPYFFDSILGGPLAAPMFLFAMGIGFIYTRKQNPKDFFIRGLKLGALAFSLNLLRFFLPLFLGYLITGDREQYLQPLLYRVFGNDVLQFSALCLLLFALLKKLKIPDFALLLLALIMRICGSFLSDVDTGNQILNVILGHFVGIEDAPEMVFSDFPLLLWFIVPVCGYIFAKKLISCENKKRLYLVTSLPCLIFAVFWFARGISRTCGMFDEGQNAYYHMGMPDMLASICAAFAALGIYYLIIKILPQKLMNVIVKISAAITYVYCIQWIIVMWATDFLLYILRGSQLLPEKQSILLGYAISILSVSLGLFLKKKMTEKAKAGIIQ